MQRLIMIMGLKVLGLRVMRFKMLGMKMMALTVIALTLAACGQKGPLYIPQDQQAPDTAPTKDASNP